MAVINPPNINVILLFLDMFTTHSPTNSVLLRFDGG